MPPFSAEPPQLPLFSPSRWNYTFKLIPLSSVEMRGVYVEISPSPVLGERSYKIKPLLISSGSLKEMARASAQRTLADGKSADLGPDSAPVEADGVFIIDFHRKRT